MSSYAADASSDMFRDSRVRFTGLVDFLGDDQAAGLTHSELEDHLHHEGIRLLRQLMQDSLDLRAMREQRLEQVTDVGGVGRGRVAAGRERGLTTIFGSVVVARNAYRQPGHADLHPADAGLNLPAESHSFGLRRLAAIEAARGSYQAAGAAIERATGVRLGKRQIEALAGRAAVDVDAFYAAHAPDPAPADDVLVLSFDDKGVVMRPDGLRPATAKAAAGSRTKLASRLSKGEKPHRKRMAEVAAVYDLTPVPRTIADILPTTTEPVDPDSPAHPAPVATGKWLHASIAEDTTVVIAAGFAEADRRDPHHARTWIALVDGNNHQIQRIRAEARCRGITLPIVVDIVHVLGYLWKAVWCFFGEGDPAAETWVHQQARAILAGQAGQVAAAIRRKATYHGLDPGQRRNADVCADYLHAKKNHLDYPTALAAGWPIATGVIEGACRPRPGS